MKDKKINLTIFLLIVFLIIGVLGFSYAYFKPNVIGNGKTNVAVSGDLRLNFNDEVSLSQSAIYPGDSFTKVFTITNMGAETLRYAIKWEDYTNTFINGEIHIELTCLSYINYSTEQEEINGDCEGIEEIEASNEPLKEGIEISSGITHEYNVTITFIETGENQDYNKNKVFNATLKVIDNVALALNLVGGETEQIFKSGYEPGQTIELTNPVKGGHTFLGWSVAGFGSSIEGNILTVGAKNTTIIASWLAYEDMYTYTGNSTVIDDGDGNWRIKFLTSGTFTPLVNMLTDIFAVGGGAGGRRGVSADYVGGGGGGGYTNTQTEIVLMAEIVYNIVIGSGGESSTNGSATSAFGFSANGGITGSGYNGGAGGSGGGASGANSETPGVGGSNGSNGGSSPRGTGGTGQGTTTREFENVSGSLYATGGNGGNIVTSPSSGGVNTGNGGDGSYTVSAGTGGSGVVIIRNSRNFSITSGGIENIIPQFTYGGNFLITLNSSLDWKIKFLSSGGLNFVENINVDVFLVGGGAGGRRGVSADYVGGGGGGGYTATHTDIVLSAETVYNIVIGFGGGSSTNGSATSAFGFSVNGGITGSGYNGGAGGSGGGASGANSETPGAGGNNGSNGGSSPRGTGGTGQGTTTREFGNATGLLYASGGKGGNITTSPLSGVANTGNGGDGSYTVNAGIGGSGIVVIRKKQ